MAGCLLHFEIDWIWVSSHQEEEASTTYEHILSEWMDVATSQMWSGFPHQWQPCLLAPHFPSVRVSIQLQGARATGQLADSLHTIACAHDTRCSLCNRYGWTLGTLELVDWEALKGSLQGHLIFE